MSHGRTQLCPWKSQCQRPVQRPDRGGSCIPSPWGQWPQDWGATGHQVLPPFLPELCRGMYEGMGLLLRGMVLLPLGDAELVFQFVLQLCGGSGHFCLKNCSCRWHGSREAIRHSGGRDPKESFQPAVYKVNF